MNPNPPSHATSLVFVAGPLRSGSTLLTLMLDRHSCLKNPGEFDFLFDALGTDGGLSAAQKMSTEQLDDALSDDRGYLALEQLYGHRLPASGSTPERLREVVDRYAEGVPCLALSIHRNFVSAHELFPHARFIHLLRDPRDCARSAVAAAFAGNVYFGLQPWLDSEESWDRLKPRLAPEQFIEIRFEELVDQPEQVLGRICRFLGLAYEPQMLDLAGTTYESPSPRFANQWRRSMSASDMELVEARVGEQMEARGYARVRGGKAGIPFRTRLLLRLHNMLARHRHGVRAYGIQLWASEIVARRLGLRAWLRATRLRMFPIKARTLK